jgi:predicted GNAT superfamily acetyltransferase
MENPLKVRMEIRDARVQDYGAMLDLNRDSVHFLSPLDLERLDCLCRRAAHARVMEWDGGIAAFLLAFRENAGYDSPNYLWFAGRYERFLYIDRVVVHERRRGRGAAGMLYRDLFSFAAQDGVEIIACEVDVLPPNPISLGFHRNRGFAEVGTQWIGGGKKQVSLMVKQLDPGSGREKGKSACR